MDTIQNESGHTDDRALDTRSPPCTHRWLGIRHQKFTLNALMTKPYTPEFYLHPLMTSTWHHQMSTLLPPEKLVVSPLPSLPKRIYNGPHEWPLLNGSHITCRYAYSQHLGHMSIPSIWVTCLHLLQGELDQQDQPSIMARRDSHKGYQPHVRTGIQISMGATAWLALCTLQSHIIN